VLSLDVKELKISKPTCNEEKKEILHNGQNLVAIYATKKNKFVTAVMRHLFTEDELKTGLIIEKGKKSKTSFRTPLDVTRVQKLKG